HAGSGEGYWACVRMAMAQIRSRSASASCAMADGAGQSSVVRAGYAVARLQGVPCPAGYPFFSLLYRRLNVLTQLAQFIAICSSQILAEMLCHPASFASSSY